MVNFEINEEVIVRDYRNLSIKWAIAVITKKFGIRTYEVCILGAR